MRLASVSSAQDIDRRAQESWGLDAFALVEAAGRSCARTLLEAYGDLFRLRDLRLVAAAGSGSNGADALVCLRALILEGRLDARNAAAVLNRRDAPDTRTPRSFAAASLEAMGVRQLVWDGAGGEASRLFAQADLVLDGIAGTGLRGSLSGVPAELVACLRDLRRNAGTADNGGCRPLLVALDLPSGLRDASCPGEPILSCDATLAVEPRKAALYGEAGRSAAGRILSVSGIFPAPLLAAAEGPELLDTDEALARVPPLAGDEHKYRRGLVEIRAGSTGAAGAARLAASGAQAAGAGLVRLLADPDLVDVLSAAAGGCMVAPTSYPPDRGRFVPDAVLLGPGWGWNDDRERYFAFAAAEEEAGTALVLDADALLPAAERRFSGNAVLTPHLGEFLRFLAAAQEAGRCTGPGAAPVLSELPSAAGSLKIFLAAHTDAVLSAVAAEYGATILLKSQVMRIASSDGRIAVVDGMEPVLAAGGSGDILAGLVAGLAARLRRRSRERDEAFDPFAAAAAAAALLVAAGRTVSAERGFCDAGAVADSAGRLAGAAWLPRI